ncbi:MAG TPA: antibiotic biosynthesis monooxygenase [Allosphingosinicella sp.]|nr:antibiotic biosynthesis monooxygenase [Allosphingosinicella sp.]
MPAGYAIVWRYQVAPQHRDAFERAYSPGGDWARLFATAEGFVRIELMAARPGGYVTIDYWRSEADFDHFQAESGEAYRELDARCESWTVAEERIGGFELITG